MNRTREDLFCWHSAAVYELRTSRPPQRCSSVVVVQRSCCVSEVHRCKSGCRQQRHDSEDRGPQICLPFRRRMRWRFLGPALNLAGHHSQYVLYWTPELVNALSVFDRLSRTGTTLAQSPWRQNVFVTTTFHLPTPTRPLLTHFVGAAVGRWTCDWQVAGSNPSRSMHS